MEKQNFVHDLQQKLLEMFRASPAADLERNIKALMGQTFNKLELVTRDEFEIQVELLRALRGRVEALESRLDPTGEAGSSDRSSFGGSVRGSAATAAATSTDASAGTWTAGEQGTTARGQPQASDPLRTSGQGVSSEPFENPTPS